jgi:thioesterase domain-containing protein
MDLSETRALLRLWRQRGAYVPRGFSGQILLLRTRDTSILDARFTLPWALAGETERSLGWRLVEGCTLTVVPVPGDHANFLFRPHAAAVAAHVEDWTAQVVGIG